MWLAGQPPVLVAVVDLRRCRGRPAAPCGRGLIRACVTRLRRGHRPRLGVGRRLAGRGRPAADRMVCRGDRALCRLTRGVGRRTGAGPLAGPAHARRRLNRASKPGAAVSYTKARDTIPGYLRFFVAGRGAGAAARADGARGAGVVAGFGCFGFRSARWLRRSSLGMSSSGRLWTCVATRHHRRHRGRRRCLRSARRARATAGFGASHTGPPLAGNAL